MKVKIGVTLCVLNEGLYIGACLRSLLAHPQITRIAVVESCCKFNEHAASKIGLSVDDTAEEIFDVAYADEKQRVNYWRLGFSSGKSEVQNYALKMAGKDVDYILMVDGDELWDFAELDRLCVFLNENPDVKAVRLKFWHFWKRPDCVRVGEAWEKPIFRVFKNEPGLRWNTHDAPVENKHGQSIATLGWCANLDIYIFHYGYLKPGKCVQNKLDFYSKRNGIEIENSFENFDESQIDRDEHFKIFSGKHPREFYNIKQYEV